MTLGGIDTTKFTGDLTYTSLPAFTINSWSSVLISSAMSVNGKTTNFLNSSWYIIFDPGTRNIVIPFETLAALYAVISSDIATHPTESGAWGITCDKIDTLPAEITLTFTAQDGSPFHLTIPSSELNIGPFADDPTTWQTLINEVEDVGDGLVGGSV
ncbi:hypothetical protein B0H19DRAFT_96761 [Mycena capillaripes]|nr:hypothetical protein B0H19DRAFT_96761 [Mycena capillaripes]